MLAAGTTSDIPGERRTERSPVGAAHPRRRRRRLPRRRRRPRSLSPARRMAMVAQQEELGDLKLYRIPEPVTVAAHSQKQVAFLERDRVAADFVYRVRYATGDGRAPEPATARLFGDPKPRPSTGSACRCPPAASSCSRRARRPADPDRRRKRSATARSARIVEIESGRRPACSPPSRRATTIAVRSAIRSSPSPTIGRSRYVSRLSSRMSRRIFRPARVSRGAMACPLWATTVPANGQATLRFHYAE